MFVIKLGKYSKVDQLFSLSDQNELHKPDSCALLQPENHLPKAGR
ncbi:hypothetical protein LMI01_18870 [Companilactobacillus mindensis]|nr:hypothetical protein LMI01_18870 [Companilactobacillus mindensis]